MNYIRLFYADVTVGAKLTLDAGAATGSLKNFKQELRQAQEDVVALTAKFGATSKEAAAAAQKAALIKDAIGDAKSLVDAFNPDTKFRAFGASINTVVGGFTALQGVMGLVGVESEDLQKSLLKVQSALAISQGISQLQEGIQTFKNLGAVIQATTLFQKANAIATSLAAGAMRLLGITTTTTSTAMQVLKGAIIATGIGALVVLLGVAADAMGLFSDKTDDAAAAQKRLEDQLALTQAQLQGETDFINRQEKIELAQAKRRGATEAELFELEQGFRRRKFDAISRAYSEIEDKDSEHAKKMLEQLNELNTEGQVARINFETEEAKRREENYKKQLEAARKFREKLLEEKKKELEIQAGNFTASGGPSAGLNIEIPKSVEQQQIEATVEAAHVAADQMFNLGEQRKAFEQEFTNDYLAQIEARKANETAEYENRRTLLQSTAQLFGALGDVIGKQTAAGKALAIAQATINTYLGITEVLAAKSVLPEPAATINKVLNVATILATGISAVKNIVKTQVPGGGGGGGGISAAAPLAPQRPQNTTTQLDQTSLNAIGNATTRAYVLESDITGNQDRIKRLNRAARIG